MQAARMAAANKGSVFRGSFMKNKMVPAIMCLAFTAQTVNFSAAAADEDSSSSDYEKYYDRARKRDADRRKKARKNSKSGFFSFMQGKTFEKIKKAFLGVGGFVLSVAALFKVDSLFTKYSNMKSSFTPEDFPKTVGQDVVSLWTNSGAAFSSQKENKKGSALAAEFIDSLKNSYNESEGSFSLLNFSSGVDYEDSSEEYLKALGSLPVNYIADSGIFSNTSEQTKRLLEDAISMEKARVAIDAALPEGKKKVGKTWADYKDDIGQMLSGAKLPGKKAFSSALDMGGRIASGSNSWGGQAFAVLCSILKGFLDDNIKNQEKEENGGRQ